MRILKQKGFRMAKNNSCLKPIGTRITILDENDSEVAVIVGYEIRKNATYLIVKGFVFDNKVNILGEGRVFKFLD